MNEIVWTAESRPAPSTISEQLAAACRRHVTADPDWDLLIAACLDGGQSARAAANRQYVRDTLRRRDPWYAAALDTASFQADRDLSRAVARCGGAAR
jgi:hypothetical protein